MNIGKFFSTNGNPKRRCTITFFRWAFWMYLPIMFKRGPLEKFDAITLWPFVFYRHCPSFGFRHMVCHEYTHLFQQSIFIVALGVVGFIIGNLYVVAFGHVMFYMVYGIMYLWNYFHCFDHITAYRNIYFERIARERVTRIYEKIGKQIKC